MKTKEKILPLVTPGEVLAEEFLKPLEISEYRLAKDIGVPARRINEIVHGTRAISTDTALRFAMYFGTTPHFWLNLQSDFELRRLQRENNCPRVARCAQLQAAA